MASAARAASSAALSGAAIAPIALRLASLAWRVASAAGALPSVAPGAEEARKVTAALDGPLAAAPAVATLGVVRFSPLATPLVAPVEDPQFDNVATAANR